MPGNTVPSRLWGVLRVTLRFVMICRWIFFLRIFHSPGCCEVARAIWDPWARKLLQKLGRSNCSCEMLPVFVIDSYLVLSSEHDMPYCTWCNGTGPLAALFDRSLYTVGNSLAEAVWLQHPYFSLLIVSKVSLFHWFLAPGTQMFSTTTHPPAFPESTSVETMLFNKRFGKGERPNVCDQLSLRPWSDRPSVELGFATMN